MAGVGQVIEDGSLLSWIDQQLHKVESALALVSGLAIFSLMLLAVVSVAGGIFLTCHYQAMLTGSSKSCLSSPLWELLTPSVTGVIFVWIC